MKKWEKILISLITVFVLTMLPAESAILPGTVCVTEAAPRISSSKLTMIKGQSRTLKITGLKKGQKITWKSSNSKIVAVNKAGKLQAKAKGSATITGTVSKRKYTCKVTVHAPKLNKTAVTLKVGQTYQLKLSGTNQKITFVYSEDHLEEQQFQNRHCKQSWQAFCKICRKCYNYCSGKRNPLCLQG